MMYIIIIGWVVYPAGYFLGYLAGGVNEGTLNLVYNLADRRQKWVFSNSYWRVSACLYRPR
jgi:hypothetical protein